MLIDLVVGESKGEKHRLVAFSMCPTGGPNLQMSLCPDWELNLGPSCLQNDIQPSHTCQGSFYIFKEL